MNSFSDPTDRHLARLSSRRGLCSFEPLTIATGVLAGAGAINSIVGANTSRQMAKHQEDEKRNAQDTVIMENRMRATKDFLRTVRLEQLRQSQEESSVAEQSQDTAKQASAAKGQAMASAAERGVSGNSVDEILADFSYQQDQEVGRLQQNQAMKNQQHTEEIKGMQDTFDYRVSSVKPYVPRVQPPTDYFGPIFGAIGTTTSAALPLATPARFNSTPTKESK